MSLALDVNRIGRRISLIVVVLSLLPAVLMAHELRLMTRTALEPQLSAKAAAVAQSAARQIEMALSLGIPLDGLVDMDGFLSGLSGTDGDIGYIAVTSGTVVLHAVGPFPSGFGANAEHPRAAGVVDGDWYETRVAAADGAALIHVGIPRSRVDRELSAMLQDILIVLVVSVLVGFEIMLFVMVKHLLGPMNLVHGVLADGCAGRFGQLVAIPANDPLSRLAAALNRAARRLSFRQARLAAVATDLAEHAGDLREAVAAAGQRMNPAGGTAPLWKSAASGMTVMRAPVFLFVLAEEMSRSFLPIFARELVPAGAVELESVAISLPLSIYMLAFLAASLLAGIWCERYGPRAVFRAGASLGCLAFAATAAAMTLWDFALWRGLSAFGFGLMFIAAQTEVVDNSPPDQRSKNLSILISAVFSAAICGTSIGGVLADHAGFRVTFVVSAALTAAAAIVASGAMSRTVRGVEERPPVWVLLGILRNRRFLTLALFASIPAKIVLTGFLFYLTPLILGADNDVAAIGRVVMIYPILMVVSVPLVGRLASSSWHFFLVAAGGMVVGIGVSTLWWRTDMVAVLVAVAALGLGQGLSNTAQVALVSRYCSAESRRFGNAAVLGLFRLTERAGSIVGPLLAATLAGGLGYGQAAAVLGVIVAASTLVLAGLGLRRDHDDAGRDMGTLP